MRPKAEPSVSERPSGAASEPSSGAASEEPPSRRKAEDSPARSAPSPLRRKTDETAAQNGAPSSPVVPDWTIEDARQLYNPEGWGVGYFDINELGHVTVHPTKEPERGLDLFDLATDLQAQGVGLPILMRFPDIIRTRIETLVSVIIAAPWAILSPISHMRLISGYDVSRK